MCVDDRFSEATRLGLLSYGVRIVSLNMCLFLLCQVSLDMSCVSCSAIVVFLVMLLLGFYHLVSFS